MWASSKTEAACVFSVTHFVDSIAMARGKQCVLLLTHKPSRSRHMCLFLLIFSHFSKRGFLLECLRYPTPCSRRGHDYPDAIHFYEDFYYEHAPPVFKSKAQIMLSGVYCFDISFVSLDPVNACAVLTARSSPYIDLHETALQISTRYSRLSRPMPTYAC